MGQSVERQDQDPLAALSPTKRALLELKLKRKEEEARAAQSIPRLAERGRAPASSGQARLWLLQHLDPSSPAYNVCFALRLRGALDPAALANSLALLVARHEPLRTGFARGPLGLPEQLVLPPPADFDLAPLDLSALGREGALGEALRLAREQAAQPFDLEGGLSPLRARLLRLGEGDHLLVICLHHLISDWQSVKIFIKELAVFYEASLRGGRPELPELRVQYADYAAWQPRWLATTAARAQLDYWHRALEAAPAPALPPTDHPAPPRTSGRGGLASRRLGPALAHALRAEARRQAATPFALLLAAYAALLARLTGRGDLVVGVPASGRTRPEFEDLIGFFANTLPVRLRLGPDESFAALAGRAREAVSGALANQDAPLERSLEEPGEQILVEAADCVPVGGVVDAQEQPDHPPHVGDDGR